MANTTVNVKLLQAYDTEANWSSNNPVLLAGQMAISSDKIGMYKVGDGTSTWSALSYNAANTAESATSADTAIKLGTETVGGAANPIYLNSGSATACSSTVGSADTPVYMNNGTITSSGVSLPTTYKKWSYAKVGQSGSTTTNPYYKFAEISVSTASVARWITFKVSAGYGDKMTQVGILSAQFQTSSSGYWSSGQLVWEYAGSGIDTSKFILAHNEDESPTAVELWVKDDYAYRHFHFYVLAEGSRNGDTNATAWTLYNTSSSGSESEVTSGYTQVESTLGTLSNPISGAAATATNVTYTGSTSGTWYSLTGKAYVAAGDAASIVMGDQTNNIATNRVYQSDGTESTVGAAYFAAGNSTASGTAGNAFGAYRLYGSDSYYWQIYGNKDAEANRTLYMPKTSGSLVAATNNTQVGSGVIPTYVSSAGLVTASTSTVGSSTKPVYMSGGTIAACGSSLGVDVTGNAATATKLASANTIDGVAFDGSTAITHYATCGTAAGTAAKAATCSSTFSLVTGAKVTVKFTYANTASSPTLNVNSTGAISIVRYGTTALTTYQWNAGGVAEFVYDGTNWVMENGTTATTTYYGMTKLDSSTDSTSTTTAATPSAVKAAYDLATTANSAAEAAQETIDNLSIGGRNYIPNTRTFNEWTKSSNVTLEEDDEGYTVATWAATSTLAYNGVSSRDPIPFSLIQDQTVTLSFDIRSDDFDSSDTSSTNRVSVSLALCTADSTTRALYRDVTVSRASITSDWVRYTLTGTLTDDYFTAGSGSIDDVSRFFVTFYNYALTSLQIRKVKLELGTVATDWTPAPEDADNTVTNAVTYFAISGDTEPPCNPGEDIVDAIAGTAIVDSSKVGSVGWTTERLTAGENEYLWTCHQMTLADGATTWTTPVLVTDDYMRTSVASLTTTADNITATVSDLQSTVNSNYSTLSSKITKLADNVELCVTMDADTGYLRLGTGDDGTVKFTIDGDNLTVDEDGNVTMAGKIAVADGTVGGWNISSQKIYGTAADGTTVAVMQISGLTEDTAYVFACGESSNNHESYADCPFRVNKLGGMWVENVKVAEDLVVGGTVAANAVAADNDYGFYCKNSSGTNIRTAYLSVNNNMAFGNASYPTYLYGSSITSNVSITTSSDARLKTDISALADAHEALFDNLQPCSFRYSTEENGALHLGFTVQDTESAMEAAGLMPDDYALTSWGADPESGETYGSLAYDEIIALLVDQVQKLKSRIAALEAV